MQDLTVCLVQANQLWEDKEGNLKHYSQLLGDSAADLFVLPEMFHTGFTMNTALAEDFSDSSGLQWLKDLAQEKQAAVYTSLIIRDGEKLVNRGVFVTSAGDVTSYDKRKTFSLAGEDRHYARGDRETIVEYKGWRLQLQICYDLRFPEIARNRLDSNHRAAYDVLLYVANWPEKRTLHWNVLLKARAIENQCYVVGVNRVGNDANGLYYSGDSQVVTALGETELLPAGEECVRTIVMKMTDLKKTREIIPFLKDR